MDAPQPGFRPSLDGEQTWLRRQARRLLGRQTRRVLDSQDLSQDAQLSAMRDMHGRTFENRHAFRGWLRKIMGNRLHDVVRRQRGRAHEDADWAEVPGRERSPSRCLVDSPEHNDLWGRLRRLPERDRAVVRLRIVEELSFSELAKRLAMSEGNARVIFHRSIQQLRDALEEPQSGSGGRKPGRSA